MEYMASNSYVHRDLSARNCLVGDQQIIKIADFGRMKSCYDHNYYKLNVNSRVPLRWMSKEALNEAKYSQASDIYSFGVTLWEMYTYGRQSKHLGRIRWIFETEEVDAFRKRIAEEIEAGKLSFA